MNRKQILYLALIAFGTTACQTDQTEVSPVDAAISQCDALAAHPFDPQKPNIVPGVTDQAIDASAALAACNTASRARPDLTRLKFQMGRAALAGGNPEVARGWMFAAARESHPLAGDAFRQIEAARPLTRSPGRPSAPAANPHADFERQITGVLDGAAALVLLDQALTAGAPDRPKYSLPANATPAQCRAAVEDRTIFCREVNTIAGDNLVFEINCDSRWNQENRTCESRTGGQQRLPGTPSFFCDPATNERAPTRAAVAVAACEG